jgi:hypothetical protein
LPHSHRRKAVRDEATSPHYSEISTNSDFPWYLSWEGLDRRTLFTFGRLQGKRGWLETFDPAGVILVTNPSSII